jgi:hypothetical protein
LHQAIKVSYRKIRTNPHVPVVDSLVLIAAFGILYH